MAARLTARGWRWPARRKVPDDAEFKRPSRDGQDVNVQVCYAPRDWPQLAPKSMSAGPPRFAYTEERAQINEFN